MKKLYRILVAFLALSGCSAQGPVDRWPGTYTVDLEQTTTQCDGSAPEEELAYRTTWMIERNEEGVLSVAFDGLSFDDTGMFIPGSRTVTGLDGLPQTMEVIGGQLSLDEDGQLFGMLAIEVRYGEASCIRIDTAIMGRRR